MEAEWAIPARFDSNRFRTDKGIEGCSPLLPRFLTFETVPRPWNGFQSLQFDIAAAFGALAEPTLLQCAERLL